MEGRQFQSRYTNIFFHKLQTQDFEFPYRCVANVIVIESEGVLGKLKEIGGA